MSREGSGTISRMAGDTAGRIDSYRRFRENSNALQMLVTWPTPWPLSPPLGLAARPLTIPLLDLFARKHFPTSPGDGVFGADTVGTLLGLGPVLLKLLALEGVEWCTPCGAAGVRRELHSFVDSATTGIWAVALAELPDEFHGTVQEYSEFIGISFCLVEDRLTPVDELPPDTFDNTVLPVLTSWRSGALLPELGPFWEISSRLAVYYFTGRETPGRLVGMLSKRYHCPTCKRELVPGEGAALAGKTIPQLVVQTAQGLRDTLSRTSYFIYTPSSDQLSMLISGGLGELQLNSSLRCLPLSKATMLRLVMLRTLHPSGLALLIDETWLPTGKLSGSPIEGLVHNLVNGGVRVEVLEHSESAPAPPRRNDLGGTMVRCPIGGEPFLFPADGVTTVEGEHASGFLRELSKSFRKRGKTPGASFHRIKRMILVDCFNVSAEPDVSLAELSGIRQAIHYLILRTREAQLQGWETVPECSECSGLGKTFAGEPCGTCNGYGLIAAAATINLGGTEAGTLFSQTLVETLDFLRTTRFQPLADFLALLGLDLLSPDETPRGIDPSIARLALLGGSFLGPLLFPPRPVPALMLLDNPAAGVANDHLHLLSDLFNAIVMLRGTVVCADGQGRVGLLSSHVIRLPQECSWIAIEE